MNLKNNIFSFIYVSVLLLITIEAYGKKSNLSYELFKGKTNVEALINEKIIELKDSFNCEDNSTGKLNLSITSNNNSGILSYKYIGEYDCPTFPRPYGVSGGKLYLSNGKKLESKVVLSQNENLDSLIAKEIIIMNTGDCESATLPSNIFIDNNKVAFSGFYDDEHKLLFCDKSISYPLRYLFSSKVIYKKSYLFSNISNPTKMYLIKGDKVTLLDEKTDDSDQKWYFINYKGKKDLNMWIKAEAVDLAPKATEPKPTEKPIPKETSPQTKITTPEPVEIAKQELDTNPPKNAEVIKTEKAEPIKSANGSISLVFLSSMLGLLGWKFKNIL